MRGRRQTLQPPQAEMAAPHDPVADSIETMQASLDTLKAHHGMTAQAGPVEDALMDDDGDEPPVDAMEAPATRKASRVQNYMTARKKVRGAMKEETKGK